MIPNQDGLIEKIRSGCLL